MELLLEAQQEGDRKTALAGVREATRLLEVEAKLRGQIDSSTTINIGITPQFVLIQQNILQALAPYPEARDAVVRTLTAMEGVGGGAE